MSNFDREAEREKLREQFAEDERRQESTERMSELLLQGATMTNKHCDTCGDPVFRHDGQEFCPSCQAGGSAEQPADQEVPAGQQEAAEPDRTASDAAESTEETTNAGAAAEPDQTTRPVQDTNGTGRSAPAQRSPPAATGRDRTGEMPAGAGDLAEARAALGRTVTRLSRQAETSDDLGRTRGYLAAAKEAAEALAAVKQADR